MRDPGGVLGEIVARKRVEVAARLEGKNLESLRAEALPTARSLETVLRRPGARFIMEMKRRSPSKGESAGHDPLAVAQAYAGIADAMSVLTDAPYFGGSFDDIAIVRQAFDGPILCKDFTVDPRQVPEARLHGADAVLVMLSVLDDEDAAACIAEAERLAMGALVEVHDEAELARALRLGARILGINNRDLKSLRTELAVTERIAPLVPPGPLLISESGIATHADVERLAPLVDGFLVGSSLMAEADIAGAARRLVFGRVKVCGLTREDDIAVAHAMGASFGGLIFVPESPRNVSEDRAALLAACAAERGLPMVGVFRNAAAGDVSGRAERLGLAAVQLHGEEDEAYVAELRRHLPDGCEIWGAMMIQPGDSDRGDGRGDRTLFDTKAGGRSGGTGLTFDWDQVRGRPDLGRGLIAGGLSPDNAAAAAQLGAWALDVNSGVEDSPGVKSSARLTALFEALRPPSRREEVAC
jgi:indole-3-glycerol phosphate synthase/phosphoribosylanthranilate isomerase